MLKTYRAGCDGGLMCTRTRCPHGQVVWISSGPCVAYEYGETRFLVFVSLEVNVLQVPGLRMLP